MTDLGSQLPVWTASVLTFLATKAADLFAAAGEVWKQAWPFVLGAAGLLSWVAKLIVEQALRWWQSRPRVSLTCGKAIWCLRDQTGIDGQPGYEIWLEIPISLAYKGEPTHRSLHVSMMSLGDRATMDLPEAPWDRSMAGRMRQFCPSELRNNLRWQGVLSFTNGPDHLLKERPQNLRFKLVVNTVSGAIAGKILEADSEPSTWETEIFIGGTRDSVLRQLGMEDDEI